MWRAAQHNLERERQGYFETRVDRDKPIIVAGSGISLTLLLTVLTWKLTNGRSRALTLAETMTSELGESENRFRALADAALVLILLSGPDKQPLDKIGPTAAESAIHHLSTKIAASGGFVDLAELPAYIDRPRLVELFSLLLDNAFTHDRAHAPEQPLHIEIDGISDRTISRYYVSDNGAGISPAYRQRVCEIFERLRNNHRDVGTGIGLSLARRIVTSSDGRIWIEIPPRAAPLQCLNCLMSRVTITMTHNPLPLFDVLMIEDELADAHLIRMSFQENHVPCNLHHVQDGVEAMAFSRRQSETDCEAPRSDLIWLDLNMPHMNGREFLAVINSEPTLTNIPVIVLTTSDVERDEVSTYRMGGRSHITKPMDIEQFIEVVRLIEGFWFNAVHLPAKAIP